MSQDKYRTKDGQADYSFSFERQSDGSWRPYILSQPDYRGRSPDSHSTHRLPDGGRNYVCWRGVLRSEQDARQVAKKWADATQDYIKTGRRF